MTHRAGNRDPETGITPMDNFVCWDCQSEARGAFMRETSREMAGRASASDRTGVRCSVRVPAKLFLFRLAGMDSEF